MNIFIYSFRKKRNTILLIMLIVCSMFLFTLTHYVNYYGKKKIEINANKNNRNNIIVVYNQKLDCKTINNKHIAEIFPNYDVPYIEYKDRFFYVENAILENKKDLKDNYVIVPKDFQTEYLLKEGDIIEINNQEIIIDSFSSNNYLLANTETMSKIIKHQEINSYSILVDSYSYISDVVNMLQEHEEKIETSAFYNEEIEKNKSLLNYNKFGLYIIISIAFILLYYILRYIYHDSLEDIKLLKILGANSLKVSLLFLIKKIILLLVSLIITSVILSTLKVLSLCMSFIYYSLNELLLLIFGIALIYICIVLITSIIEFAKAKKTI